MSSSVNEQIRWLIEMKQREADNKDWVKGLDPTQINPTPIRRLMDGSKPVVICNGTPTEAPNLEAAQAIAEEQAHRFNSTAYILKPVKKVSPKRDVVTTDLS